MERLSEYQKAQKWLEKFEWDDSEETSETLATICDALQEVEKYRDAEEQGLLLRLPCKVGDTVYLINHDRVVMKERPLICVIDEFTISERNNDCYAVLNANEPFYALHRFKTVNIKNFGTTVFLTKEEASKKLAEMKGE